MIPVLIVPILAGEARLRNMLNSIDCGVDRLIVIDNGARVKDLPQVATEQYVIYSPENLGVAGSWNLGIKMTPSAPWWAIVNYDVTWPEHSLAKLAAAARPDALVLSAGSPPWCAFALGDKVVEEVGLFDEAIYPAYFEDNDYQRRVLNAGMEVVQADVPVHHANSSTLAEHANRNYVTFPENAAYYGEKVAEGDYSEGRWSLARRRRLSWD